MCGGRYTLRRYALEKKKNHFYVAIAKENTFQQIIKLTSMKVEKAQIQNQHIKSNKRSLNTFIFLPRSVYQFCRNWNRHRFWSMCMFLSFSQVIFHEAHVQPMQYCEHRSVLLKAIIKLSKTMAWFYSLTKIFHFKERLFCGEFYGINSINQGITQCPSVPL